MLHYWSLLLCILIIKLFNIVSHAMPMDFGDPLPIDFERALNHNNKMHHKHENLDAKNENDVLDFEQLKHHLRSHHQTHHKHRRSLKSTTLNTERVPKEYARMPSDVTTIHKRGKHLMLTKPYWPWP